MKQQKKMRMIVFALVSAFCLCVSCSLADEIEKPYALRELEGLQEAFEMTNDITSSVAWKDREWYGEWLQKYGLTGDYEPSSQELEIEKEIRMSEKALEDWQKKCGITNENDFSEASGVYGFVHAENGEERELCLVVRFHGDLGEEKFPDFYTLMDRDSEEILATSDVETYKAYLAEAEKWKAEWRAEREKVIAIAKQAVADLCSGDGIPTTLETLASYAVETSEDWEEENAFDVFLFPGDEAIPEFWVYVDLKTNSATVKHQNYSDYPRYTQQEYDQARAVFNDLETVFEGAVDEVGELYLMTLEEIYALRLKIEDTLSVDSRLMSSWYDVMYPEDDAVWMNSVVSRAALPSDLDISSQDAVEKARAAVMTYKEMLPEDTDQMEFFPFFMEGGIWEIYAREDEELVFRVELDSRTGKIKHCYECFEGNLFELINANPTALLEMKYGPFGEWSIEEKYLYGKDYNGMEYYGMPGENEMPVDEAMEYAKKSLLEAFPELTPERLESANMCPYFYLPDKDHPLYGVRYERDIYYFSFDWLEEDPYLYYEIVFDAITGEIYVLHDPDSSGNG